MAEHAYTTSTPSRRTLGIAAAAKRLSQPGATPSVSGRPNPQPPLSAVADEPDGQANRPEPSMGPFSIHALAQHLARVEHERQILEFRTMRLGVEEPMAPLNAKRLAQRHARKAEIALDDHIEAVKALILRSRAVTAADGVAQLLLVHSELDAVRVNEDAECDLAVLQRALLGASRAVASHIDLPLSTVGGDTHASIWLDSWPLIEPDPADEARASLDREGAA